MSPAKYGRELSGKVRISGVINDEKFEAEGDAQGNTETGEYSLRLNYDHIPRNWHPTLYSDPKVGLLFQREEGRGQNYLSLTGGTFRSSGFIELGEGFLLRTTAVIRLLDQRTFQAVYAMYGTAHTGDLTGLDFFEETMLPFGPQQVVGLGLSRWRRGDGSTLDGVSLTRYHFDSGPGLRGPQVRRVDLSPEFDKRRGAFSGKFRGHVKALPRLVEEGGPYIGHLIA